MGREIKFEIMLLKHNRDFSKSIIKHYTDLDRLMIGADQSLYANLQLVAKRQYTGLKDKNGVEVYSDDVMIGSSKCFGAVLGAVKLSSYDDNECYAHEKHLGWNICGIPLIDLINDGCVVGGNIYENPELLEQAK